MDNFRKNVKRYFFVEKCSNKCKNAYGKSWDKNVVGPPPIYPPLNECGKY